MTTPLQIAIVMFALIAPGAAAAMGWLHYAIPKWTGHGMKAPLTYVWGVGGGILAPFVLWAVAYRITVGGTVNIWWVVLALLGICACSGAAVLICYERDHKDALRRQAEKGERLLDDDRS